MKSYFKFGTLLVLILFLFSSCKEDEISAENFVEYDVTDYDILKIKEINYNPAGLKLIGLNDSNDTSEKYYIIGDEDVMISYDLVEDMVEAKRIAKTKKSASKKYFAYATNPNEEMDLNHINNVVKSGDREEQMIIND